MKKKCPNCGKYMMNVADKGQIPMWECSGDQCDTCADGEPDEVS